MMMTTNTEESVATASAPPAPGTITLAVKTASRPLALALEEIEFIQAADNYVCIHAGGAQHFVRETMNAMEARLDPEHFIRVHRSKIVNIKRIQELQPWFHGDCQLVMHSGARITLSRTYRERLLAKLNAAGHLGA
jgi:two-component system LytT family response regulator